MSGRVLPLLNLPKRERLAEQVADQVKRLILSRKLRVNDKIPSDRSLAESLNVSPVVIRSAMQSLEQSGYVEIRHGRNGGSFVTGNFFKPFLDSIYDLFSEGSLTLAHFFQTRCHVERLSVSLAVEGVTNRSIARLKKINAKLLREKDTYGNLAENNLEFHVAVAEMGGNPLNTLMVGALLNMLNALFPDDLQSDEFVKATHDNHSAIIAALERQDSALAESVMIKDAVLSKELKVIPPIPKLNSRSVDSRRFRRDSL